MIAAANPGWLFNSDRLHNRKHRNRRGQEGFMPKATAEHSKPDQVTVRRANSVQAECILSVLANKSELISSTFANLDGLSSQV